MTPLQTLIREQHELQAKGRRVAPCPGDHTRGCHGRKRVLGCGQPGRPQGSAGSFGFAVAGWSLGWWEVAGRMHGCSVGRCWVCLGLGIIYPVPLLVPIPAIFAINSSILAGAGLTSSTSGASGRAQASATGWSCLRQWRRAAGPAAHRSRMEPQEDCDSCPASPNPTLPVLPYPCVSQSMGGPTEQVFLPAWSILPQYHPPLRGGEQSCSQEAIVAQ